MTGRCVYECDGNFGTKEGYQTVAPASGALYPFAKIPS